MMNIASEKSRTVTKGIYNVIDLDNGQKQHVRIGETKTDYHYSVNADNDRISINGKEYKVVSDYEFTIKIQKTQIKAINGAAGLMNFLSGFQNSVSDNWERKIIENCRPVA